MDLNMSRTGGKKATQLIRSNHKLDNVPVIILTTSDGRGTEKQELIRLGANAFYTKPMNLTELIDIVQTVRQNWLNILFDHNALA
jgi:CheY-like chemotaxis protein